MGEEVRTFERPATYAEGLRRLEELSSRIEREAVGLEELDGMLGEADNLLEFCREELYAVRDRVERVTSRWIDEKGEES